MLYFLYGQDVYRLKEKISQIRERYKKVNQTVLALEYFDFAADDFSDFFDNLKQTSLFLAKKLFILENVFLQESIKQDFLENINALTDSSHIIVITEAGEAKEMGGLFRVLQDKARCQEFKFLTGQQISNWLKKRFAFYKTSISSLALFKLQAVFGLDLWGLNGAVKTLSAYSKNITEKEIALFFAKPSLQADIFKTIESAGQRNKQKALGFLQALLDKGENPFYLLTMFAWQFKNLALAKQNLLKAKPFVVRKSKALSLSFSFEQIKKIFQQIMLTDLKIKTGKALASQALQDLILSI